MGDFRKKYPDFILILSEKIILQGNTQGKKISLMAYNVGKKNLTPLYVGGKMSSPEVLENNSYPNQITPSPSKVKRLAPK